MTETAIFADGRMTLEEAANYLGFKKSTLNTWRVTGKGPRFRKIAGKVFYMQNDLDAWLAEYTSCKDTIEAKLKSQCIK